MSRDNVSQAMWDRMPHAVREYIEWMEMRLEERDKVIRELKVIGDRNTSAGIIVNPHADYSQVVPADRTIRFWVEPGKFAIDCTMRSGNTSRIPHALNISGYGSGSTGMIAVAPIAGNVVSVFRADR